jgi:outer membrane protein assembly factor BamB
MIQTKRSSVCPLAAAILLSVIAGWGIVVESVDAQSASTDSEGKAKDQAAVPASKSIDSSAQDWAFFRGDSASTGVAQSRLPTALEVQWQYKIKNGAFEGTASIVTDPNSPTRKLVLIGDLDGKLLALDLATGEKAWEFSAEIGFNTTPVVRDGRVFIGNLDGKFFCLDLNGKEIWNFQANGQIDSSANFFQDNVLFGSQDACLYALNRETGKQVWKYESQDQIRCSITVAEDKAFVAGCDGFFHVVDLKTGTGIGKVEIFSPTGSTPASLGPRVFFGNQAGEFFAINSQDLTTQWTHQAVNDGDSIIGGAAVTDQHVVFGNRNRNVTDLDPQTGAEKWKVTVKSKIDSSPVIVDDRVYVASTDGRLYALALKDGAVLWERQFNGGFISSPAVAFERLVIATNRGVVYCLGQQQRQAVSKASDGKTPSSNR